MSTGDAIALVNLVFSVATTVCVLFLAYAALAHTARPNLTVRLRSQKRLECGTAATFIFELINLGHWYASPMAVDVTVYCNFPPEFGLHQLRYGSVQEHSTNEIKNGVGGMCYLRAKGIKLSKHEGGEEIHVLATTPRRPGSYRLRVSAYSANGASVANDFLVVCSSGWE
jgi:hypothetical protein